VFYLHLMSHVKHVCLHTELISFDKLKTDQIPSVVFFFTPLPEKLGCRARNKYIHAERNLL